MTFTRASMATTTVLLLIATLGTTVIYQSSSNISWYDLLIGKKIFLLTLYCVYCIDGCFGRTHCRSGDWLHY